MYKVTIKHKAEKNLMKMPKSVRDLFFALVNDLKNNGAIQKTWHNFSALGGNKYHCHLNYSYVACWTWNKNTIEIEVYYVGSRESAPY